MNNIESNKLIAEFMGLTPDKYDYYCNDPKTKEYRQRNQYINYAMKLEELEYHTSWDWLMPVVERINTMGDDRYTVFIFHHYCEIYDNNSMEGIVEGEGNSFIEHTYNAVVEFIKL